MMTTQLLAIRLYEGRPARVQCDRGLDPGRALYVTLTCVYSYRPPSSDGPGTLLPYALPCRHSAVPLFIDARCTAIPLPGTDMQIPCDEYGRDYATLSHVAWLTHTGQVTSLAAVDAGTVARAEARELYCDPRDWN